MKPIFTRSRQNPILKPHKRHAWESLKVYNPGAIYEDGKYHIFYRALGTGKGWCSSIGYAVSRGGERFIRSIEPILLPRSKFEVRGLEDPRITKVGNLFFLTYTAFDGRSARLFCATSKDFINWDRRGEMMPSWDLHRAEGFLIHWGNAKHYTKTRPKRWNKSGGIFSKKIGGKYWMLFGDSDLWLAHSSDGIKWEPVWQPFIQPREGYFDSVMVEMGPPPIRTKKGWLVLYHGVDKESVYRLGFLLLDLENPSRILYRSERPIFQPQRSYELSGIVDILPGGLKKLARMSEEELNTFLARAESKGLMPKVAFCCGATLVKGVVRIYYGASDTSICTATARLEEILHERK